MDKSTNTIGNLYGLRAGLSVISQECDKIDKIEAETARKVKEVKKASSECNEDIDEQNRIVEKYDTLVKEYKPICVRTAVCFILTLVSCVFCSVMFVVVKNKYAESFNFMVFVCGGVLGVALICVTLFLSSLFGALLDFESLLESEDASGFLIGVVSLLGIASGIATLPLFLLNGTKNHAVGYCGLLFAGIVFSVVFILINFIRFISNISGYTRVKGLAQEAENEMEQLERTSKEIAAVYTEDRAKIDAWRVKNLATHVNDINKMYTIMRSLFQPMLDERDWKHLDLVIYYLETRRADSIKEALQLVDRELQTQRIENLVVSATQTIVSTLNSGFSMLQQSLGIVYNGLSEQLKVISGQISAANAQMINSQVMNRALMAKANVTSEALVNDLHKIRENSDYIKIKAI